MRSSTPSRSQKTRILRKLSEKVKKHVHAPRLDAVDWDALFAQHLRGILDTPDDTSFQKAVSHLLGELQSSHIGFYRRDLRSCSAKAVLAASYADISDDGIHRWVFQNVHPGGPAAAAGIQPGDVLISIDGKPFQPPEHPTFAVDSKVDILVETAGQRHLVKQAVIPALKVKWNQLPKVEPSPIVSQRKIESDTGYLKVASYPGQIGVDVANDISKAARELGSVRRLVIDLRGNPGGGIGVLRLMSLLTPEKVLVGVNVKGKMDQAVSNPPKGAFVLDKIPSQKIGLLPLATRYFLRGLGKPIAVMTEGLGPQPFHGRVVVLVDRNTSSANEMFLAFAREHELAKIVGERTPGRVLTGDKFKLPYGYTVVLPIAGYETTQGNAIEGNPIDPDIEVEFDPKAAREGRDTQLETAVEVVRRLE